MKRIAVAFAAAAALAAGVAFADGADKAAAGEAKAENANAAEAAPVKKAKPKPKKPYYTKLRPAKEAAAEWEQPIVAFFVKSNDDDSTNLKRKIVNRKELKTLFADNCVVLLIEIPVDRKGRMEPDKLGKEEAAFYESTKSVAHGFETPGTIVADSKGVPKAQVGKYVLETGAGQWVSQLDAAVKVAGFKNGLKMTKEAQKLVDDNKPDGKTKVQKKGK